MIDVYTFRRGQIKFNLILSLLIPDVLCPPYSASGTYYASRNFPSCTAQVCGGETIVASGCSSQGGSCSGNQYLRLQAPGVDGWLAVGGYGYCGSCAQISYSVSSGAACQNYTIAQGCDWESSCSGATAVKVLNPYAAAQGTENIVVVSNEHR